LENIHHWLLSNKLTLNVEKTEYMIIGTRQRLNNLSQDINVSIDGIVLKEVETKKILGVLVDEHLCWDKQRALGIGMLRRVKPYVTTKTLKHLYQALVQPHFDYCSMVWGNCGEHLRGKLHKLQNRAARVITGDPYEIRSIDILKKLEWKTLSERRKEGATTKICIKSSYMPMS
jgi:hypothetical protein